MDIGMHAGLNLRTAARGPMPGSDKIYLWWTGGGRQTVSRQHQ